MVRSFCTTWPWFSASSLPLTSLPPRSRTAYSYVSVAMPSPSDPAEEAVVVLDVVTLLEAMLVGDLPRAHQLGQVLVERVHAVLRAGLHRGVDLVRLSLADEVADGGSRRHDLRGHDTALAVGRLAQRLADDPLDRAGQLHPYLLLLLGGEDVDDAVDGLCGVLRVQGREHQVTGLCRGERDADGLQVAELTDQDDVGILTQGVLERAGEGPRVLPHLALVHQATLVTVEELDGVLDRHDVLAPRAVGEVEDARERRGLAGPGRPRDEHHAAREGGEVVDGRRDAERLQRLDLVRDQPERRAERLALAVDVHAEPRLPGHRVGEVELELVLEPLALLLGEQRVQRPLQDVRRQHGVAPQRPQLTALAHHRRRA